MEMDLGTSEDIRHYIYLNPKKTVNEFFFLYVIQPVYFYNSQKKACLFLLNCISIFTHNTQ